MADTDEKGPWAKKADEGVVPAEPEEKRGADPELGSDVTGRTTGTDEPTTEEGIDREGGDQADATTDGGADAPADAEPDLKDAPAAAVQRDE
jgi:hypothetical protein